MAYSLSDVTAKLLPKNGGDIANLTVGGKTVITSDGGTLNDSLSYTGNVFAKKTTNNSYIVFQGGSNWEYGAYLQLNGSEKSDGASDFSLASRLNGNHIEFRGKNDGSLTWNGKNIVRSVNDTNATSDGHVNVTTLNPNEASTIDNPLDVAGVNAIVASTSNTTSPTPSNGVVLSVGGSSLWKGQLLIADNQSGLYFRGKNNGTWNSWTSVGGGTVSQKASASLTAPKSGDTEKTYTISGLTQNKPLYIGLQKTSTSAGNIYFRVSSGTAVSGYASCDDGWLTVIPTATSVVISYISNMASTMACTLKAYQ